MKTEMGNGHSVEPSNRKWSTGRRKKVRDQLPPNTESSRVLFLLYLIHRTWNVVVEHVDKNQKKSLNGEDGDPDDVERFDSISLDAESEDNGSMYSFCSCSYCRIRETNNGDNLSETFEEKMASGGWSDEPVPKEKQRPPIYNPEDYVNSLKKWGKKPNQGHTGLYNAITETNQDANKSKTLPSQGSKDFMMSTSMNGCEEMSLRQFNSASELLTKLRADLRMSFPSFVQEFSSEPLDGVTLLLDLLRNIQLSLSGEQSGTNTTGGTPLRVSPAIQRRAMLDELACLQCLWSCCSRYPDVCRRVVAGTCSVYSLAVCIMSTVNKSRIIALQLLTKACYPPANGHTTVSEALSTLRLRYGEPVRFRFLIGMIQSGIGNVELQSSGMAFINSLLISAPSPQRKLYIQAELEQAGFDLYNFKKMLSKSPNKVDKVTKEIEIYERQLIDIDTLSEKAIEAMKEKDTLKNKLEILEKRVMILQEEKGILKSLEKCLKEKCCELQEEVTSLRSEHGNSNRMKSFCSKKKSNRDESSPPEDEGISSSERSLSPETDGQRDSIIFEVFNTKNEPYDIIRNKRTFQKKLESARCNVGKKPSDDEDEATIEEVIQELRNIVNDAETEQYKKNFGDDKSSRYNQTSEINVSVNALEAQCTDIEKDDSVTSTKHSIRITDSTECLSEIGENECEIVPSNLLPLPPRKSKSLVHLFVPPIEQGIMHSKTQDLYDDTFYSSDDGSDSLLSASRYHKQLAKKPSMSSYELCDAHRTINSLNGQLKLPSDDDGLRKPSFRRSDSFCNSETGSMTKTHLQLSREKIDSLFYDNHKYEDKIIMDHKKVKSIERIDNGLDSMVDIVMPTPNRFSTRNSTTNSRSSNGDESPLIPITKPNPLYNNKTLSSNSISKSREDSHKFYIPHPKLSNGSYENQNGSFANNFMIRRGVANAGFYSGQLLRDAPASMTSLVMFGHNHSDLKRAITTNGPKSISNHSGASKLRDMPSGLY